MSPGTDELDSPRIAEAGCAAGLRFVDRAKPVPFEEVLAPLVVSARQRLAKQLGTRSDRLAPEAHATLENLLLRRLSILSARTLHLDFSAERMVRLSPIDRIRALADAAPLCVAYRAFTERMLDGGFDRLLRRYPVLARLIPHVIESWIATVAEFVERLETDDAALARAFGAGASGRVMQVAPALSDPHRGGRMVMSLDFASGLRIAYKPKDLGTERAFNRLLAWFNDRGAPLPFRILTVLARPDYGWVEWVEHEACRSLEEVHRYYERAGMLAALVYALAGTDCHHDNLIAAGEHPMLIDTESLLHHRVRRDVEPSRAREMAFDQLVTGVLGTGMLPNWQVSEHRSGAAATDISALHTPDAEELVDRAARWQAVNTDGMRLAQVGITNPRPKSQPMLADRPLRLEDFSGHLLSGFERFYRFLIDQRPALLERGSPLHELGAQPVRFLFRNTQTYGELLWELAEPAYLAREDERQRLLAGLGETLGTMPESSPWWPLIQAEQESLDAVDIPFFWARADGTELHLGPGRELRGCLSEPSAQLVIARIEGLGPRDLERQLGFVAGSLHASAARHHAPEAGPVRNRATRADGAISFEHSALEIANQIADRAIRAPSDGSATWIGPQFLPQLNRYQMQPVGYDLHSGGCGIALLLATVAQVTGAAEHAELARAAVQPLRQVIESEPETLADELGVGAASGVGGMVYGLTRLAQLLDEPVLLLDAATVGALLTEERIIRAPADAFSGLAGEILGQLALYEAARDQVVLDRAAACGRRLLEMRRSGPAGRLGWITFQDRMLTGFSHGSAGIAYALLRLYEVTHDDSLRHAAEEAIAVEDALFDVPEGNWPDLREDQQPTFKTNWCHGAPGIGLARVGGMRSLDTKEVRRDLEAAIATTLKVEMGNADHACCGNLGRVELLLVAGTRLRRPDLIEAARRQVQAVASRAEADGGFSLPEYLPRDVYTPGFFMGMAGIGYQLLRTARPELVPSVLLWE